MKKYKFKKSVIVKDNQSIGTLVFFIDKDQVYQFTGDAAHAILIIHKHSKEDGASEDVVQSELSEVSETFKKNEFKKVCINELVEQLTKLELLEA